jgi:hypothetical protein
MWTLCGGHWGHYVAGQDHFKKGRKTYFLTISFIFTRYINYNTDFFFHNYNTDFYNNFFFFTIIIQYIQQGSL